jgi:hypothetical protein
MSKGIYSHYNWCWHFFKNFLKMQTRFIYKNMQWQNVISKYAPSSDSGCTCIGSLGSAPKNKILSILCYAVQGTKANAAFITGVIFFVTAFCQCNHSVFTKKYTMANY